MIKNQIKHKIFSRQTTFQFLRGYYIITPVFLLIELLWGLDFRVPFFLTSPFVRYGYYALCLAGGVVCYFRPKTTAFIAFFESIVNVSLVFVSYGIAYYDAMLAVAERGSVPAIFTPKGVLSFAIPATVCVIGFYHCQDVVIRKIKEKI